MKQRVRIIMVLLLILLFMVSCKSKEHSGNQIKVEENDTTSEKVIVEDEVTVNFGTEEDKKTESDGKAENTTAEGNTSTSGNSVNKGQTDNDGAPSGSDTSSVTKPGDSDNKSEEPKNPYDKDGDGYVDGWY